MFSPDTVRLIRDVLELFAHASQFPIALYELDENENVVETIRSSESLFPQHCQRIWKVNDGAGRKECNNNMCERAQIAIHSLTEKEIMCHAGLSNITQPVIMDGKAVCAIQYGAFLPEGESDHQERINNHKKAMQKLRVGSEEAAEIRNLLLRDAPRRTQADLLRLRTTLAPILTHIISEYVLTKEREQRIEQEANHDLQLKLQAILAHAENLTMNITTDSPWHQPLNDILGATEAAGTVMHTLSRGEYLPQEYVFQWRRLRDFIDRAIVSCQAEARKKDIDFVIDLQPQESKINIQASEAHLEQAINNLIQNAVKYSYRTTQSSQKRFVKISGRFARNGYEVRISNYGVGIESDEYDAIFREGYKGKLTRAEYRTGSGQGLALTKRIIEAHGGEIAVASEPRGEMDQDGSRPYVTRFTVWLPLRQLSD